MTDLRTDPLKNRSPGHTWRRHFALALAASLVVGGLSPNTTLAAGGQTGALRGADQISTPLGERLFAQRRTCRSVSSCEEAVRLWCGGYSRADGDNDGIPCENLCTSKREVDEIRARIGC
ncbi:excalibur calcium-binding domain-containing protein [Jiella pacifica]|uniref:excalibur calcium-binding domain-containing protein n=1 Tax=Jiella pacifica TaxID=2696469 RepID=UPI001FE37B6E|nr:excalibur calcium-binding domain-containing protein [Jiella pacifica]